MTQNARRTTMLSPPELYRLDLACIPIRQAFGHHPYLVGSTMEGKSGWRDVDVRLILPDEEYDQLVPSAQIAGLYALAISSFLQMLSALPVDFQIQRMTQANELHGDKMRNPLGRRHLENYKGDGGPWG